MKITKSENAAYAALTIYGLFFIITFGRVWIQLPPVTDVFVFFIKGVLAGVASLFWPLYWSVQFWS
jgi:hypothetical protein